MADDPKAWLLLLATPGMAERGTGKAGEFSDCKSLPKVGDRRMRLVKHTCRGHRLFHDEDYGATSGLSSPINRAPPAPAGPMA